MKEFIRKKIKSFIGINILENKIDSFSKQRELLSLQLLVKLLPEKSYFPITSWSLSPNALLHIVNDIIINKRKSIIEFGPGYSTLAIARLIKINQLDSLFISVESDLEFVKIINIALQNEGLENYVTVVHAPLDKSKYDFRSHSCWYSLSHLNNELAHITSFDLVIVDGPPGSNKYTRYGAIPFIQPRLDLNYCVFLDDTYRSDEMEIAQEWNKILGTSIEYQKGYTVLYNNKIVDTAPMYVRHS